MLSFAETYVMIVEMIVGQILLFFVLNEQRQKKWKTKPMGWKRKKKM